MKGLVARVSQLQYRFQLGRSGYQARWPPQEITMPLLLISSTILVGFTGLISYKIVRSLILDSLRANAMLQVQKAGDNIDEWLSILLAEMKSVANNSSVRSLDWSVTEPYLQLEQDRLPDFYWFQMAKPDGSYYNTRVGLTKANIKNRIYFQQALAGKAVVDDPVLGRTTGIWQAHLAVPIWSTPRLHRSQTKERALIRTRSLAFFHLPSDPYQKEQPIGVLSTSIPVVRVSQVIEKNQ